MAAFSLWIITTLLSTLQTDVAVVGLPTQNLHHHMTKREIEHFFGVDDHEKVPEYDISNLYQSDEQGDLSYPVHQTRNKRDTEAHEPSFYKLHAFGSKLHLKLKRNDHLMAPGLTILRQNSDGTTTAHPAPENTFYLGQVASDPRSTVAVSNDGGLTGMVKTSRDTLFVKPLPAHMARRVTSNEDETPHLVYRRSLPANHVWCKTPQDEETTRLRRSVEDEYVSDVQNADSAPTEYRTVKVALMYPSSLRRKYNEEHLNSSIGGVENFLLLNGNIVAGLFQDPSFGNTKITYVVTQILMIDPAQYGFHPSNSSSTKLRRIYRQVLRQNHAARVPYDVFSYVSDAIPGGALAFANQICRGPTGNVNKEIGLQTALHLAHETGHNMYLNHDHGSCAGGYIMNAALPGGIHATEWSGCSRNAIQGFLADRGKSHCLDDGPTGDRPELPPNLRDKLPGVILNGQKQCESQYGVGWRKLHEHECAHMRCIRGPTILGRNLAAMDGTSCGRGKWCIKGKCLSTGIVVNIASVGWSNWGSYSQCTRTCGGGVQHRSRKCNSPAGSKFCKGEHLQHRICNPQACTAGSRRFRDQQCDERQQGSSFYGNPTCVTLLCRSGNVVRSKGVPVDGTRCTHNIKDYSVCIHGSCRPVGCDHVLHSRITFDLCGVCGGNGTCKLIEETYTGNPNGLGPVNAGLIAELLPGTYNANFDVMALTRNYLGVQDAQGNYLVGGNLGDSDQTKEGAGTVIKYRHRMNKKGKSKDRLQIAMENPTNALLRVVYIKNAASNPGVKYHYLAPVSPGDVFEWVVGNWSKCSKTCASGTRTRSRQCIRQANQSPASDAACPRPIPKNIETCNTQPCEAKWTFSEWTVCSQTCGLGIQTRTLKCLEEVNDDHFRETNSCADPKPTDPTQHDCNNYPCPSQWKPEQWSKCSAKCAVGTRQRTIVCSRIDAAGVLTTIDGEFCRHLDKPASEGKCNEDDPCGPRPPTCPADHLCSNGGQCKSDPSGYKCNCDRGFTGEECEIKLNPCDNNPCLNGGICSPGVVGHHFNHTCQCTERFTGRNCETAITACMSSPCLYDAACADNGSHDQYTCTCLEGFHGKRCQVPDFHAIACFVYKKKVILELGELKDQLVTVAKCAEHVHVKGYKFFALGLNGKCFSGLKTGVNYFRYGATAKEKCVNGVGKQGAAFAYTFDPLPAYEQVGCFKFQKGKKNKAFKIKYMDFRKQFNSKDTNTTVERCLRVAIGKGFKYFAIRDKATCWSDKKAAENYNKYGSSNECTDGVGLKNSIMVYRIKE